MGREQTLGRPKELGLLSEPSAALRALSVFAGGGAWRRRSGGGGRGIEEGEVLDLISRLVDKP